MSRLLAAGLLLGLGAVAYGFLGTVGDLAAAGPGGPAIAAAAGQAQSAIVAIAVVGALALFGAASLLTHRGLRRPLCELAQAAERLATGDKATSIPGATRPDEIGAIARAFDALREAAVRDAKGKATDDDQSLVLAAKVETFAQDLGASVRRLAAMTQRLTEASNVMIVAAQSANEGSDQAKTASADAAGDVSSVATASEQLLVSIEEISRQVLQSTTVVKNSVERTVETNAGMNRLATAAQKVGDVVSLISRIAAQTNLLALNATIEAARAGEAGRGFAVVAQEVKTLATQTAKATQDITGQIAEIQEATETSVGAIEKIQGKISEVEHISTLIAAAVHEQGAATQAIARNVRSAASGTATVSGHVEKVVRSVGETSASASSVAALAQEMDEIASAMTAKVLALTQALKAA